MWVMWKMNHTLFFSFASTLKRFGGEIVCQFCRFIIFLSTGHAQFCVHVEVAPVSLYPMTLMMCGVGV